MIKKDVTEDARNRREKTQRGGRREIRQAPSGLMKRPAVPGRRGKRVVSMSALGPAVRDYADFLSTTQVGLKTSQGKKTGTGRAEL